VAIAHGPRAKGTSIEVPKAPRGMGSGEGVSPSGGGGVWRGGSAPLQKFFVNIHFKIFSCNLA